MTTYNLDNIPVFEFSTPSIDDLKIMGLSEALYSPYNVKAVYEGQIVGYITVQDKDINLPMKRHYTEEEKQRVKLLKSKKWFLIRRISFKEEYKETGNLYNMFDYLIKILPNDSYLWSNVYWDRKTHHIQYVGGFTSLPEDICGNNNLQIFSVYQARNE